MHEGLPAMRIKRALAALGISTGLAAFASETAEAQATCDWYAKTALEQQKTNIDRKCGLKGLSWSSDRQAHIAWCATVAPDEWKRQAQLRDQALAKCLAGK